MPSHPAHRAVARLVLGKAHPDVDRTMDGPFQVLGPKHRAYFHDPLSLLAMFGGDRKKLEAALLHLLVDETASANPEAKAAFELLGATSKRKRRVRKW